MKTDNWNSIKHQLDEIVILLQDGLSEAEVIERMGVDLEEWNGYKATRPEIAEALAAIPSAHVKMINQAMWDLAVGYKQKEITKTTKTYPNGEVEVTEVVTERHLPPNLEACREMLQIMDRIMSGRYNEKVLNLYDQGKVAAFKAEGERRKQANAR